MSRFARNLICLALTCLGGAADLAADCPFAGFTEVVSPSYTIVVETPLAYAEAISRPYTVAVETPFEFGEVLSRPFTIAVTTPWSFGEAISRAYTVIVEPAGDLDADGDVDLNDLTVLLAHFGLQSGASREDGDLDGDHAVSLGDLTILLADFGTICRP